MWDSTSKAVHQFHQREARARSVEFLYQPISMSLRVLDCMCVCGFDNAVVRVPASSDMRVSPGDSWSFRALLSTSRWNFRLNLYIDEDAVAHHDARPVNLGCKSLHAHFSQIPKIKNNKKKAVETTAKASAAASFFIWF